MGAEITKAAATVEDRSVLKFWHMGMAGLHGDRRLLEVCSDIPTQYRQLWDGTEGLWRLFRKPTEG